MFSALPHSAEISFSLLVLMTQYARQQQLRSYYVPPPSRLFFHSLHRIISLLLCSHTIPVSVLVISLTLVPETPGMCPTLASSLLKRALSRPCETAWMVERTHARMEG